MIKRALDQTLNLSTPKVARLHLQASTRLHPALSWL